MKLTTTIKQQQGLSLIELLVSMTIALIIMAGVVNTISATKQSYLFDEEVSYIQENARFALDTLSREIREAGYTGGCNLEAADVANSIQTPGYSNFIKMTPVDGFEGSSADIFPSQFSANVLPNTDSFIVRRGITDNNLVVNNHNGSSATINVTNAHAYRPGTVFMMVNPDCEQIGVFAMSGPTNSGGNATSINHNTGTATVENCTQDLYGPFDCSSGTSSNTSYDNGSTVFQFGATAFYIRNSSYDTAVPALYSHNLANGGAFQGNELVSGVEDFEVEYGIDNDVTQDGKADQYFKANQITADNAAPGNGYVAWDRVVTIRIQMVMRSRNQILTANRSVTLLGATYVDRYIRQLVSSTVQLRNVALPGNG